MSKALWETPNSDWNIDITIFTPWLMFGNIPLTYVCNDWQISVVLFCSHRYNKNTGAFTVSPGGAGLYYFSTHLWVTWGELARFHMKKNDGEAICKALGDNDDNGAFDGVQGFCSGLAHLEEGECVVVSERQGEN